MKPLQFFVPPDRWFGLVEEIADRDSLEVIFRRLKTPRHPAGYHLASLGTILKTYRDGEFHAILFSVGEIPAHDQDWHFTSRSMSDILESTGGNWQEDRLGIRTLRILAKRTRVKPVFNDFRRALVEICEMGMESEGAVERDILYVPNSGWRYMSGPEEDAEEYNPV